MPAMMVPAKHEHNYAATILVVVEDSLGAATSVEVSFQVRLPLIMSPNVTLWNLLLYDGCAVVIFVSF